MNSDNSSELRMDIGRDSSSAATATSSGSAVRVVSLLYFQQQWNGHDRWLYRTTFSDVQSRVRKHPGVIPLQSLIVSRGNGGRGYQQTSLVKKMLTIHFQ